jgi:hypothetical protein
MTHHNVLMKTRFNTSVPLCPRTPVQDLKTRIKPAKTQVRTTRRNYLLWEEYLVTALVPSDTACLANSPGRMSLTEVWISRDEMVDFLL